MENHEANAAALSGPRTATASHTPGPWHFDYVEVIGESRQYEISGNSRFVAGCGGNTEQDKANAHLIAAAPDLLALVKRFAVALGNDETLQGGERVGLTDRSRIDGPALNAALIEAKAIVARATGAA